MWHDATHTQDDIHKEPDLAKPAAVEPRVTHVSIVPDPRAEWLNIVSYCWFSLLVFTTNAVLLHSISGCDSRWASFSSTAEKI